MIFSMQQSTVVIKLSLSLLPNNVSIDENQITIFLFLGKMEHLGENKKVNFHPIVKNKPTRKFYYR